MIDNNSIAAGVRFSGAPNFRDLAGIRTLDGRQIAPRRIYRTEALTRLSVEEMEQLAKLGVKLVIDLRAPAERERHPVRLRGISPRYAELEVLADVRTIEKDRVRDLLADESGETARQYQIETYRIFPKLFEKPFAELIDSIVNRHEVPLVIQCTAGKDRTGFLSSLLLLALDIPRDSVMEEYLRSNRYFGHERVLASVLSLLESPLDHIPSPGATEPLTSQPEYLDAALQAMETDYGSIGKYLEKAGKLSQPRRATLQRLLLEPSSG